MLLSVPFADPKAAGVLRQTLSTLGGAHATIVSQGDHVALLLDGVVAANGASYPDEVARAAGVLRLRSALDALAVATAEEAAAKAAAPRQGA